MSKNRIPAPDGAEVERIRQVRQSLDRRFKTFDALWEHVVTLDKKHREQVAKKRKRHKPAVSAGHKRAS